MVGNPVAVERVVIDFRKNRLILDLKGEMAVSGAVPGTIDIGALGRLIGVEVAGEYLAISDPVPGSELVGRSEEIELEIDLDRRRLMIPRQGPTWEISFPSGNQCWNRRDSSGVAGPLCAVIAGA